jgi:quinol-cytochrome oxidoreductase complex cytochrome b subunit
MVNANALLRFYVLHCMILPLVGMLLLAVHFWRIRKDGGLSRPLSKLNDAAPAPQEAILAASPEKTYGLMEVVTGKPVFETVTAEEEDDAVFSFPYAFYRETIALLVTVITVMSVSLFFNAPLEEMANPAKTPNPAKAPWYFLGLQEMVSHSAFIGGVLAPALIVLALIAIPYFDTNPSRRPSQRKWAIWVFTVFVVANLILIVIGTFFRGHGWSFVLPWAHVAGGE